MLGRTLLWLSPLLLCAAVAANELLDADNALMRGDYPAAAKILEELANAGNVTAMVRLANLYHRGEGVERDMDKAVAMYLSAAESGHPEAQFNLGNMYLLGEGLPQDEDWAITFYRLAAKQGHVLADRNMRELARANGIDMASIAESVDPVATAEVPQAPTMPPESGMPDDGLLDSIERLPEPEHETVVATLPLVETPEIVVAPPVIDAASKMATIGADEHLQSGSEADLIVVAVPVEEVPDIEVAPTEDAARELLVGDVNERIAVDPEVAPTQPEVLGKASVPVEAIEVSDFVAASDSTPADTDANIVDGISNETGVTVVADTPIDAPVIALDPIEDPMEQTMATDEAQALRLAQEHGIEVQLAEPAQTLPIVPSSASGAGASEDSASADEFDMGERFERAKRAQGLERYTQSRELLEQLDSEGYAPAALLLADMSARGEGIDAELALRWRKRAADLGSPEAQYQLAELHLHGDELEADEAMAITFYRDAARGGHELAKEKLDLIYAAAGLPMPNFAAARERTIKQPQTQAPAILNRDVEETVAVAANDSVIVPSSEHHAVIEDETPRAAATDAIADQDSSGEGPSVEAMVDEVAGSDVVTEQRKSHATESATDLAAESEKTFAAYSAPVVSVPIIVEDPNPVARAPSATTILQPRSQLSKPDIAVEMNSPGIVLKMSDEPDESSSQEFSPEVESTATPAITVAESASDLQRASELRDTNATAVTEERDPVVASTLVDIDPQPVGVPEPPVQTIERLAEPEVGQLAEAAPALDADTTGPETPSVSNAESNLKSRLALSGQPIVRVGDEVESNEVAVIVAGDEADALRLAQQHGIDVQLAEAADSTADAAAVVDNIDVSVESDAHASLNPNSDGSIVERFKGAQRALRLENYDHGIDRLKLLSEEGYAPAALLLAGMAARGEGIEADAAQALEWRERAAVLGSSAAQYQLAEMHMHGRGVEPDEAMAITFYRDAARSGHASAQEKLGLIYADAGLPIPDFSRPRKPIAIHASAQDNDHASERADTVRTPVADATLEHDSFAVDRSTPAHTESLIADGPDQQVPDSSANASPAEEPALEDDASTIVADADSASQNLSQLASVPDASVSSSAPEQTSLAADTTGLSMPTTLDASDDVSAAMNGDGSSDTPLTELIVPELVGGETIAVFDSTALEDIESPTTAAVEFMEATERATVVPATAVAPALAPPVAALSTSAVAQPPKEFFGRLKGLFPGDTSNENDANDETTEQSREPALPEPAAATEAVVAEAISQTISDSEAMSATADTVVPLESESMSVASHEVDGIDQPIPVVSVPPSRDDDAIAKDVASDAEAPNVANAAESTPLASIDDGKRALAEGRFTSAMEIFTRLADDGNAEAQAHLGYMYYEGGGVDVDLSRAVEWYRRAATLGNRIAQYNLAVAYAFGEGVDQDDVQAVMWYRHAAEQGSAIAQYSLGVSYALGEGVGRDDAQAVHWYREAAEQGYAVAQYSLGYMYRSGRGVTRDLDEAIKWYRLAAARGHPDARADLASLNTDGS